MSPFIKISTLAIVIFTSSFCSLFSQSASGEKLDKSLFSEELVVKTDRDIYIAGEQVMLKIFKVNGLTRTPGNVSKVVYVDVLDKFNNPVAQLKIGIKGFSGSGEFFLPDTLRTGNYLIRSCTSWMQNFSKDLFSYKRISVINPFKKIGNIMVPIAEQKPDSIAFYPEGGHLVRGIETAIGLKCYNHSGSPAVVNGYIINSKSDTLCYVNTGNSGAGLVRIKPSDDDNLYLVAEGNRRYPLPSVQDSGIIIGVKSTPGEAGIILNISEEGMISDDTRKITLVYSPASAPSFRKEIFIKDKIEVILKKDTLPVGLARIILVDGDGTLLANRWVYNDKSDHIFYEVSLADRAYSTREKVRIGISARDDGGRAVKSDLMVSVVKSFTVDKNNSGNAPGYMQLPTLATMATDFDQMSINDYLIFYENNEDLLKSGSANSGVFYLPELGSQIVSGVIRKKATGEPLRKEVVVLSFVGKAARCSFSKTDDNGCFNFVIDESGTREIVIQPLSPELSDYYVELKNPFPEPFSPHKPLPFYPDSSRLAEINDAVISMQIKSIYDPYLKAHSSQNNVTGTNFFGSPVDTILIYDYIELNSLKEVIKEIVPGVTISRDNGKSSFNVAIESLRPTLGKDPLVLVDGVVAHDKERILAMNPGDLEKIEVLKKRYFISDIVIEGIVHFVTKKGDLSGFDFDKAIFRQEFEALLPEKRYEFPDYSVDSLKNSRIPDFRNTLYWDCGLSTDESGNEDVEFYTSDEPGDYILIVEGISRDGKRGRAEILLHVEGRK